MEVAITKVSSKGQIVIPAELRRGLRKGERLLVMKSGKQWIMKKFNGGEEHFKEDLEFARRTEEAWKRIERGEGIAMDFDAFIEKIRKH